MTGTQIYHKIHTNFQREELMNIRALQGHSRENLDISTLSQKKIEKGYALLLYHIGFSGHEDSVKSGGPVPGGVGTGKNRKNSVLTTRVANGSELRPEVPTST